MPSSMEGMTLEMATLSHLNAWVSSSKCVPGSSGFLAELQEMFFRLIFMKCHGCVMSSAVNNVLLDSVFQLKIVCARV